MSVVIVGAGIGGLTTALALRAQGIDVQVLEQARELTEIGAGLQIASNAVRVLDDLGLAEQLAEVSVAAKGIRFRDLASDELLFETPLGERAAKHYGRPFYQVHRADLLGLLAEALPAEVIRLGAAVTDVEQDEGSATVVLAGGERIIADAVIGADGIHSSVREWMLGPEEPHFSGVLGWRAMLSREEADDLGLDHSCDAWLGPGRSVVTYWLRPGELFNVIGFVPAREVHRESWTDSGDVDEMRKSFADSNQLVTRLMEKIDSAFITGVYFHDPAPRWSTGRVTLLGDAAHATQPYLAQGACQSIEDAAVLARLLNRAGPGGVAGALAEYERRRSPRTTKVQVVARAAERFWHESDPQRVRARNGRFRGLARIDPLTDTVWGWLYHHDPIAALERPPEEALGLATAHDGARMKRRGSQRAAELWRAAFTPEDHIGGWQGLRAGTTASSRRTRPRRLTSRSRRSKQAASAASGSAMVAARRCFTFTAAASCSALLEGRPDWQSGSRPHSEGVCSQSTTASHPRTRTQQRSTTSLPHMRGWSSRTTHRGRSSAASPPAVALRCPRRSRCVIASSPRQPPSMRCRRWPTSRSAD